MDKGNLNSFILSQISNTLSTEQLNCLKDYKISTQNANIEKLGQALLNNAISEIDENFKSIKEFIYSNFPEVISKFYVNLDYNQENSYLCNILCARLSRMVEFNMKLNIINQTFSKYFCQIIQTMNSSFSRLGGESFISTTADPTKNEDITPPNFYMSRKHDRNPIKDSDLPFKKFNFKRKRLTKQIVKCPHKDLPHYAKGMCSNCYHSRGRDKKAWKCPHKDKVHYALGVCQYCYQTKYFKSKKVECSEEPINKFQEESQRDSNSFS